MALELFGKKFLDAASKAYKGVLARDLNKIGVRYEDLLNNEWPEVKEAMELADADVMTGRYRRLKRASDVVFKGKVFTDYAPALSIEETFKEELTPDILKIQAREDEYAVMDMHKK